MATNDFKELIKKLTTGIPATFLKDLDMTWNMPNLQLNSNNMLVVSLAKTTTLPIMPNVDDVFSALGASPIPEINDINRQFNLLHVLVQKYCVQQFTLGSLTHQIMDNMIDGFDEITDNDAIDTFMNYVQNVVPIQKGGSSAPITILNCIFVMILLLSTVSTESLVDLSILNVNQENSVSVGALQLDDDAFKKAVVDRNFSRSTPVNIGLALNVYDRQIEKQKETILGKLMSLISNIPGANDKLTEYISDFNERSRVFSSDCEKQCVDLMIKSYENKLFENLRQVDDIAETEEKIRDLNDIQQRISSSAPREIFNAAMAAASSSVASVLTQDYGTPAALWLNLPYTVYDKLATVSSVEKEKVDTLQSAKKLSLTAEEKSMYNNKLFSFSKFYCQNSYHLKLQYQNNHIHVLGDKIDYLWIVKLIDTLRKNIDLQDAAIEASTTMSAEQKKVSAQILQNISDRFDVLRTIVDTLSNLIVNYGVYSSLTKEVSEPSPRTLDNIETYFDEQLKYLNNLLDRLYETQCKDSADERCLEIKRKQLEEQKQIQQKKLYVQKIQNELATLEASAENQQREFDANLTKTYIQSMWTASQTQLQSYVDVGISALIMGQTTIKSVTREATKVVASPLAGVLEGAFGSILELVGSYARLLLTTPGGLSLLSMLALIASITGGGWLFLTFKWLGRKIVAVCVGPFVFLYEVLKTGSGYILRRLTTFVVASEVRSSAIEDENYNRFLAQQEEGEEYNPDKTYGGKMKKKRITRKHKKAKKTHKKKNLKKHHRRTKHKFQVATQNKSKKQKN